MSFAPVLVGIMGPTASGKSAAAEALADVLGAQLINADAFLVYRGLDIGTAKPTSRDRYRLLDLKEPWESYGVGEFVQDAAAAICDAVDSGRPAIVVGGTGLYQRALFEGYSDLAEAPDAALRAEVERLEEREGLAGVASRVRAAKPDLRIDWSNPVRVKRAYERILQGSPRVEFKLPPVRKVKLALDVPVEELKSRIDVRVTAMLEAGWIEEVRGLIDRGVSPDSPGMRAIGYSAISQHIAGEMSLNETIVEIQTLTRQYAKRQRSWLRNEPNLVTVRSREDVLLVVDDLLGFIGAHSKDNKVKG